MEFVGVQDYNTYIGIKDGMAGSYDDFCDMTFNEPRMPLESFKMGHDAYILGYYLGLCIVGRA